MTHLHFSPRIGMMPHKRTNSQRPWGVCTYNILHDLRHLRRAKDEWIIDALHLAIKRLPRCIFNDERRAQIMQMQIGLERAASFEREFAMTCSRCI